MKKSAMMLGLLGMTMMLQNNTPHINYDGSIAPKGGDLQDAINQEEKRKRQAKLKEPELNKTKGLRQWAEFGDVWAATKKAAKKKYDKMVAENHR